MLSSWSFLYRNQVVYGTLGILAFAYILFQKKYLPKPLAKIVSMISFYPTIPFTYFIRRLNLWTPIDSNVILGCAPMAILNHPQKLHKLGVRGVINLCAEYEGPIADYNSLGMSQLYLPTIDHFEPSVPDLIEAVKFIKSYAERGEKVYVHCKAGHGRSAAVVLCWLVLKENSKLSAQEANSVMCKARDVRAQLYTQPNITAMIQLSRNQKKETK